MIKIRMAGFGVCVALCVCFLVACATSAAALPAPEKALPASGTVSGWQQKQDSAIYDRESLYDFMNGEADLYFTYGFEELAVGQYANVDGEVMQVEVYRLATDADAYGLFTYNSYGEPLDLGMDGELIEGYRLSFWQKRIFVQIVARNRVDNATLRAFGEVVASALPEGGERPALVEALPVEEMQPGSVRFFREKMALDNLLWIGSEDVLGLGMDTEGVLARYEFGGRGIDLMLIAFPDAARAQAAQSGLDGAEIEGLVATDVKVSTLGAVFGQVDKGAATDSNCGCESEGMVLVVGQMPKEAAKELLEKAMAALP